MAQYKIVKINSSGVATTFNIEHEQLDKISHLKTDLQRAMFFFKNESELNNWGYTALFKDCKLIKSKDYLTR